MANSVRVSSEHDAMIEKIADNIEDDVGFRPDKKTIVEDAIEDKYEESINDD